MNQVVKQKNLMFETFQWLSEGLALSERWIFYVPGDAVQHYLNFRDGTSNTINAPPQGAPPLIHTNNAPRIQGTGDAVTHLVVEGVNKLRITEFEDM